jgi:hypothetical protein
MVEPAVMRSTSMVAQVQQVLRAQAAPVARVELQVPVELQDQAAQVRAELAVQLRVELAALAADDQRTRDVSERFGKTNRSSGVTIQAVRWLRVYSSTTFATNSASSPSTTRSRRDISRAMFRTTSEYERKSRR